MDDIVASSSLIETVNTRNLSTEHFGDRTAVSFKPFDQTINPLCRVDNPKIIVWGCAGHQFQVIEKVIVRCNAKALHFCNLAELDALRHSAHSSIAVVELVGSADVDAHHFEAIHRLSMAGFTVISHGRGVIGWPLGVRCKSLAVGTSHLLDSESEDFPAELERLISGLLAKGLVQESQEQQIRNFMRSQGVAGGSRQMANIFRQIARIGPFSDLPVLITGESGTGKELVARAIHRLDPKRGNGPFIALNCGAISSGLAESELFGHKKGAFTGAHNDRKGLFRAAHGGVLFLDEIGELSLDLQVKLLRVLQENKVLGVGHDEEIAVNFRIIAATHRDFGQMIGGKEFRVDLYHRLNVLSLHIPPLRERPEDVRPLIEHFLHKNCPLVGMEIPAIGQDFVEAITCLPLSGNARELENIVRRSLLCKQVDSPLHLCDLPNEVWRQIGDCETGQKQSPLENTSLCETAGSDGEAYFNSLLEMESKGWDLSRTVDDFEKRIIQAVLQKTRGNQTRAAQILGITPRSVYNKIKKYQLDNGE